MNSFQSAAEMRADAKVGAARARKEAEELLAIVPSQPSEDALVTATWAQAWATLAVSYEVAAGVLTFPMP